MARVAVDVPLAHLDRPFDYLVPATLDEAAVPGCRVRIRFAGRLTGGYLLERAEASDHQGTLAFLERVLSPEPVLTPRSLAWPGRSPTATAARWPTSCGWPSRPVTHARKRPPSRRL